MSTAAAILPAMEFLNARLSHKTLHPIKGRARCARALEIWQTQLPKPARGKILFRLSARACERYVASAER
jgi:hypothetical protein